MPSSRSITVTAAQEAKLAVYRQKWLKIGLSTEPLNVPKASEAIQASYRESGYAEPEILHYSSPWAAIQALLSQPDKRLTRRQDISLKCMKRLFDHNRHVIWRHLGDTLATELSNKTICPEPPHYPTEEKPLTLYFPVSDVDIAISQQLCHDFYELEEQQPGLCYGTFADLANALCRVAAPMMDYCLWDFCISELGVQHDAKKWRILQDLALHCGFLMRFEQVCILIDRPCQWSLDAKNLLHSTSGAALQFADGYGIFAHHGRHPSEPT